MKITILTLFPEMFEGFINNSIIKRAIAKNVVEIKLVNIRDYTNWSGINTMMFIFGVISNIY